MTARLQQRFGNLPAPARGILWMTAAGGCYAVAYALVRQLTLTLPIAEVVFLRGAVCLALMLPWLSRAGLGILRSRQAGLYTVRAGFSFCAMMTWFFGLKHLPLTDATALAFTVPIFTVLMAIVVFHEHVGLHRWGAILAGFAGVMIILRPGMQAISIAALAVLASAVLFACTNILTKQLTRRDPIPTVVFYQFLTIVALAAVPTALDWVTPRWQDVPWIILIGLVGTGAQQGITRAFAAADYGVVMPFNFLRLPMVAAIAFAVFGEEPDGWTWAGAAVVFGATWYIARREAMSGKRPSAAGGG